MMHRLRIAEQDLEELRRLVFADMPREAGAFALVGVSRHGRTSDVLVRRAIPIPRELVDVQHEYRLELSSRAINGLAALCEANQLGAMLCHSHPMESSYSPSDDHGERRVFAALRAFMPLGAPTVSLLFTPNAITGRVWKQDNDRPMPLDEIVVVGRSLRRISLTMRCDFAQAQASTLHDRQVRAFGHDGQALIGRAKVGIVGVGGTGSPTAEQLVRLGVRDLILIDPDYFEESNRSRVYGTFGDAAWWRFWRPRRQRKVHLVARHLKRISPDVQVKTFPLNVVSAAAADCLRDRDIVFLCTDDHWGRSVVNQLAYQYLIPVINVGVSIRAENERISHAVGVVDLLRPGLPCLWCKRFLNSDRIAEESMPQRDREARAQEGYVQGINAPAPSVISMTTALSGMAVSLFLQLVTDFMGDAGEVSRLNYDVLQGTVRRGTTTVADTCACRTFRGLGDLKPLPTISDRRLLDALSQ